MIARALSNFRSVCILGLAASVVASVAKIPHAIDPSSAVGIAISLWIASMVVFGMALAILGLARLAMGVVAALASLAIWTFGAVRDPLGLRQSGTARNKVHSVFTSHTTLRVFHVW